MTMIRRAAASGGTLHDGINELAFGFDQNESSIRCDISESEMCEDFTFARSRTAGDGCMQDLGIRRQPDALVGAVFGSMPTRTAEQASARDA